MRRFTALLLLPALVVLSGCLRLKADFVITSEDDIGVSLNYGIKKSSGAAPAKDEICETAKSAKIQQGMKLEFEPYEEGDWVGCRVTGTGQSSGLDEGFTIKKQDDGTWLFRIDKSVMDAGTQETNASMWSEFSVSVTFPGKVLTHNGSSTVKGRTVTWTDANDLYDTGLEATGEEAPGSASASASPTATATKQADKGTPTEDDTLFGIEKRWVWIGAAVAGALVLLGLVAGAMGRCK